MAGTVEHLPPVVPPRVPDRAGPADDHPMRRVTRQVAAGEWDESTARSVGELFDALAGEWHTRDSADRLEPLLDAVTRGRLPHAGTTLEVGSGTGLVTPVLAAHLSGLIALDLSEEMLRRAPAELAPKVRADQAALPFPDRSVGVLAHVNALLFPAEVDRVLAPDGAVLWVCTRGEHTPIYLSAEDVVTALPGDWSAVASEAGAGTWAVVRRAT